MHSTDRILTTHVGSLVRPDDLVAVLRARSEGDRLDAAFSERLRTSVAEVVRRQAEIGIDVVSDGEFGKTISWSRYVLERLKGFEDRPDPSRSETDPQRLLGPRTDTELFRDFYAEYNATQGFESAMRNFVCTGPIPTPAPTR